MSDAFNPATFFDAVSTYQDNSGDGDSKGNLILATVHSYVSGRMRLIIDGEDSPTTKTFNWVGPAPAVGKRVCVAPIANTFLVLGEMNNDGFNEMAIQMAKLPKGIIATSRLATTGPKSSAATSLTVAPTLTVSAVLEANRRYRVGCTQVGVTYDAGPSNYRCFANLRQNLAGGNVNLQTSHILFPANQAAVRFDLPSLVLLENPTAGSFSASLTVTPAAAGTMTCYATGGGANPIDMFIEDLGAMS